MGLDINAVQFLIAARKSGVQLGDVLMLGRQDLNVYPAKMRQVLSENGCPSDLFNDGAPDTGYAEPCFRALGATNVRSMDVSAFEGAEFVHDLNRPIPQELKQRFDIVYDGGTLEHVFHFSVALQNCMEMVRPGGRLFIHTIANNYCGHGFYQFSPELFFRTLSPENGFEVERMVLHAMGPYGHWFEVTDPQVIQSRVELISCLPMQLLIRAKRTAVKAVFEKPVQQSDFVPRWKEPAEHGAETEPIISPGAMSTRGSLSGSVPGLARLLNVLRIGTGLLRTHTTWNRRSYRPIKRGS
jgi:SAM-dependent methyltransferase